MKCSILAIGDELLIGQVINTNAAWISIYLRDFAVDVIEHRVVADDHMAITKALHALSTDSDIIICTGGLGPTADDITKSTLAEWTNDTLAFNAALFASIESYFSQRGWPVTDAHRQQCYLPSRATLWSNGRGTAPGMLMAYGNGHLIALPGVPYEVQDILSKDGERWFKMLNSHVYKAQATIRTAGTSETNIEKQIQPILSLLPEYIKVAYLPSLGTVRVRVSGQHRDRPDIASEVQDIKNQIVSQLGDIVFGFDDTSLSAAVGSILIDKAMRIGTIESCTGGTIAATITAIPGSSAYYDGSIVAYSNDVKSSMLGVPDETIERHGAISEPVVRAMLISGLKQLNVDCGIAVSGIAGPSGGSPHKPVGSVWIAYGTPQDIRTAHWVVDRGRIQNIKYATNIALNLLRKFLMTVE